MTLNRLMTTVVVATPVGSPPPYAKLGQGVMGGTIAAIAEGDALDAKFQLDELQHVFQREFGRGDLTVGALQLDLWQAHWYRTSRQAMQRAADMLILAAATDIPGSSKLARECEGLAKVLDLFVNAQPKDHPIGDALLRGEPVPDGVELERLRCYAAALQTGVMYQADIEISALRADGIHPFINETLADRVSHQLFIRGMAEAELARISGVPQPTVHRIASGASKSPRYESVQAIAKALQVSTEYLLSGAPSSYCVKKDDCQEISRRTRDAYVAEYGSDSDEPTALLTAEESHALAEQIRSTADAVEAAGATAGSEQSPFAVYEFPHEMREALRLVSETLGGIREVERLGLEPTPEMRKVSAKVLASVDELLGRVDGEAHIYRPTFVAHEKMIEEAIKYRAEKKRQANIDEIQAAIVDIRQQLSLEQNAAGVTAKRTYQELERIERGLMALAKAIGPMATDQMMAAMERPA